MSTSKFTNSWKLPAKPENSNISSLAKQLLDVTLSLIPLYQNRATVSDNLNMEYKSVRVESGKPIQLTSTKVSKITGLVVVDTGGLGVTSQSVKIVDTDKVKVVLEYAGTGLNPMTFLILGE